MQPAGPRRRNADADALLVGGRTRAHPRVRARVSGLRSGSRAGRRRGRVGRGARAIRTRTRRRRSGRPHRTATRRGGRRHAHWREVPPRALRLVSRRRRRPCRSLGRRPATFGNGFDDMTDRVASIDCGTNSIRLLVGEPSGDGKFTTIDRRMRITRLGQGVDATGRLAPEAIERTMNVLREFRSTMDQLRVERVRMTATSAARDAANREDFFAGAETAIGVRPELLTGEEEARLSFAGATAELDPAGGPYLVVDIGGGSTEFAAGHAGA